jgi:hypothetical protein
MSEVESPPCPKFSDPDFTLRALVKKPEGRVERLRLIMRSSIWSCIGKCSYLLQRTSPMMIIFSMYLIKISFSRMIMHPLNVMFHRLLNQLIPKYQHFSVNYLPLIHHQRHINLSNHFFFINHTVLSLVNEQIRMMIIVLLNQLILIVKQNN